MKSVSDTHLIRGATRICFSVCLAVGPAMADDRALLDLPFEDLLEIEIRSAGKRDEQIRDIPASVTIITREEIARYGYVTFEELLKNVPGLFMLDNTGERFIGARGSVGGGIQFLVNGIPQHESRQKALPMPEIAHLNIPVESIDRIEVVRGPMSVVYGNNAFLGVVNVVTNSIDRHGSRVSAGLGSRDSGRLFVRAGTLSEDGFILLNAGAYRTDGLEGAYADMMSVDQLAGLVPGMHKGLDGHVDQRDLSLQLSAGWGGWSADLRYTENDYGFYILSPGFDDGNRARVTAWHAALGWEHSFAENLGLRADAVFSEETADVDEFDFVGAAPGSGQLLRSRRWDLEADLFWDPRPDVNLLAGYRFRVIDDIENRVTVPPVVTAVNEVDSIIIHDLFAELGWDATDRLRLTGGLRLSRLPDSYRLNDDEVPIDDRTLVTGRVAALWNLDAQQVVKLLWGTAAQENQEISFREPERIETTEVVYVQTRPASTLSASLFRNRISKIVRTIQKLENGEYRSVRDNSGEWTTHGLELIGELRPLPTLNLGISTTWQDTDDSATDTEPGYSPQLLVKLKADYRRGRVTYAAYAHYVSAMEADWDFSTGTPSRLGDKVDDYWNLGVNLRYQHPNTGLFANLNVSNLLDTEVRYPANELADFARGLIGPGRVITATLGYEF